MTFVLLFTILIVLVAVDVRYALLMSGFRGKFAPASTFEAIDPAPRARVAIARSDDLALPAPVPLDSEVSYPQIEDMTRRAVDLMGGLDDLVHPGDKVLINPNIVTTKPSGSGVVTDVRVVKAVARLVHEAAGGDVEIIIGEGCPDPVDYELDYAHRWNVAAWKELWDVAGYQDLLQDPDVAGIDLRLSNLNGPWEDLVQVEVPGGGYAACNKGKVWIHQDVLNADVLISVPVMKIHTPGITVALKNSIGLYPSTKYGFYKTKGVPQDNFKTRLFHYESDLPRDWIEEEIADIDLVADVDFVVVDAVVCLERSAFGRDRVRRNMILAGADMVAVDHVAARLMGLNPDDIAHITLAAKVGLGTNSADEIEVVGSTIEASGFPFKKNSFYTSDFGQSNRTWLLRGPFEATGIEQPIAHAFIPDEAASRPQTGQNGWSEAIYFFDDRIDLGSFFQAGTGKEVVAYAFTYFDAPQDQKAELWLGSDEAMRIYLNGDLVYDYSGRRTYSNNQLVKEKVPVRIREGENALLVKVLQERGAFDFALNICEPETDPNFDGNRVFGLKFRLDESPLVGSWVQTLPNSIARGVPVNIIATVFLHRFSAEGEPPQLTADLSALGGPADLPLVAVGDSTYRLETNLPVAVPTGRKSVSIQIEQVSTLGSFKTNLVKDIVVLPTEDLVIFADTLAADWQAKPSRGELDLQASTVVYQGSCALALQATFFFRVDCQPAAPVELAGYQCLHFAFHPSDATSPSVASALNVMINGSRTVKLLGKDREEGGVDMELKEWQVVEIPLDVFPDEPIREIRFEGNLKGTFYLDDLRLVTTPLLSPVTAVAAEPAATVPQAFALEQNYPNPFNANTIIPYHLQTWSGLPEQVLLEIYNLQGQRVRTLVQRPVTPGRHLQIWDGRDQAGKSVSSGAYLYRLQAGGQVETRKLLVLR